MLAPPWHLSSLLSEGPATIQALKTAVGYASKHTGVPAVVVTAGALVASYRIFRRSVRLAVELALAMTVVLVASRLGWIRF